MNLYQLTTDFDNYMNAETDEDLAAALAEITAAQIEKKAENYCQFFANLEGDIAKFKQEEQRINAARKALENKLTRAKEYMKSALYNNGLTKLTAGTFKISIVPTAGKLVITDEAKIPAKYKDVVTDVFIRNADVKNDIANGIVIEGAYIEEGTSLRIK